MGAPLRMNPEIRELWVRALRSGEYRQGKGTLHKEDHSFCCLGVLCDLAVKRDVIDAPELNKGERSWQYADGMLSYLPHPVVQWAGLDSNNPQVDFRGETHTLSALNDGFGGSYSKLGITGRSFSEIADVIEGTGE